MSLFELQAGTAVSQRLSHSKQALDKSPCGSRLAGVVAVDMHAALVIAVGQALRPHVRPARVALAIAASASGLGTHTTSTK